MDVDHGRGSVGNEPFGDIFSGVRPHAHILETPTGGRNSNGRTGDLDDGGRGPKVQRRGGVGQRGTTTARVEDGTVSTGHVEGGGLVVEQASESVAREQREHRRPVDVFAEHGYHVVRQRWRYVGET